MLEGKKISELETTTQLQNACCFPVLNNGTTRRITFGSLLSQIENNLPDSGIEQVKEDVEALKNHARTSEQHIDDMNVEIDNMKNEFDVVDEMVRGQNATIRNCVSTVNDLNETIAQTHFDDVLELEEQVRVNETNIESKQDQLTNEQLNAVNSGITAEKVAQFENMSSLDQIFNMCHPIGEVYVQFPTQTAPQTLYGRGTWTDVTSTYAGLFFRAAGGNAATFGVNQVIVQDHALQGHTHIDSGHTHQVKMANNVQDGAKSTYNAYSMGTPKDNTVTSESGTAKLGGPTEYSTYGTINVANETRPRNTAIKIWKRTA